MVQIHSNIDSPEANRLRVGDLVLHYFSNDQARLYSKNLEGQLVEIGKGSRILGDLEDVDLTNATEGSFFVRQGDKWVATNFIGSINNLSDVELDNPTDGQYLRYDSLFEAVKNYDPSYRLKDLTDVEVADPTDYSASEAQNNQVLYYDSSTGTYKTRTRLNTLNELEDVAIDALATAKKVLMVQDDGIWRDDFVRVSYDSNPVLSNNLTMEGHGLRNSTYKVNTLLADESIVDLDYRLGDYWVIEGVSSEVQPLSLINFNFSTLRNNTVAILLLEVRQDTGQILLGGLQNIKYEDGKPIQLSGNGNIDLVTITVKNDNNVITTYVTINALNLATLGNGGIPAYRYDKNRYPDVQNFNRVNLYDDFFDYVKLYLNFEPEVSTNRLWQEDKSYEYHTVITEAIQTAIPIYSIGLQESVAEHINISDTTDITTVDSITLDGDFTLEFFTRYLTDEDYYFSNVTSHVYFTNQDNSLQIKYEGVVGTDQETELVVTIGLDTLVYDNAVRVYRYQNNRYIHHALVRKDNEVRLFIDGIRQQTTNTTTGLNSVLTIDSGSISTKGYMNSFRITTIARYWNTFDIPDMRFGLVGGANDILDRIVENTYYHIDSNLEQEIFSW